MKLADTLLADTLDKAVSRYNCGDLDGGIMILERFLKNKSVEQRVSDYARAYLYLGVFNRFKGYWEIGSRIQQEIADSTTCDPVLRANALVEQANIRMELLRYEEALEYLKQAEAITEQKLNSDQATLQLMHHFFNTCGLVTSRLNRPMDALENYRRALDHLISLQSFKECPRNFITIYLNLYSVHMVLGNIEKATDFLTLAHAKMQTLKSPFAFGLIHFFENLAAHNLFAAGSQNEAIKALTNISEKLVQNFSDSRKVFDFFSSIIVQLHDGNIDLEKIRESIRDYGDDPLIKAYLPTLLTGAPPPRSDDGDDDIPAATLTD